MNTETEVERLAALFCQDARDGSLREAAIKLHKLEDVIKALTRFAQEVRAAAIEECERVAGRLAIKARPVESVGTALLYSDEENRMLAVRRGCDAVAVALHDLLVKERA